MLRSTKKDGKNNKEKVLMELIVPFELFEISYTLSVLYK
ncbi:Uncharacterised protein [Bartonella vinsonii]|uniref:Uncharacterized protein n=1 Tax=Bartonella vinsonii TaxID=33047 RepID=A0A448V794_BARVI|nr:Uncharacterised protein [Bartonella vinsonii]